LPPLDSTVDYARYKAQQFDLLADAMRKNIDIDRIYQIMHQHQERAC
jgi:adenosylcobyric acid synthase